MKKTILLPILLLGLTLASCGSSNKAGTKGEFKDLKYGEALPADEAAEVALKAYANINQVSAAAIEEVQYLEGNNAKVEAKGKSEIKFSSEGYFRSSSKTEISRVQQGLTFSEKHEYAQDVAFATKKIEEVDVYSRMTLNVADGVERLSSVLLTKAAAQSGAEYMAKNQLNTYFNGLNGQNVKVFKVKKGFEAVTSSIEEEHTAVQWDQGYKEYITITKIQRRYIINDKYQVTEMHTDQEYHTNRDGTTGAWYDKVVVTTKIAVSAKAKYDAKASDSALSSELVSKGANSMLTEDLSLGLQYFKVDGDTITPSYGPYQQNLGFTVREGINAYRAGLNLSLGQTQDYNGFSFIATAAIQNDVFTAAAAKTTTFAPAIEGATFKQYTVAETTYNIVVFPEGMPTKQGLLTFEFISAKDALTIGNVQFQLL